MTIEGVVQVTRVGVVQVTMEQGQDSRLKMRTFLKLASLGYGVNKQY